MIEIRLRRSLLSSSVAAVTAFAAACGAPAPAPGNGHPSGSGGQVGSGGMVGSGGTVGSGGVGTGGTVGAAGVVGSGGLGSGGVIASGGSVGSGGFAGSLPGTGGTGSGGDPGSGGAGTGGVGTGGTSGGPYGNTKCSSWPTANGDQAVSSTIEVNGTYDGGMKRFYGTGNLNKEEGEGLDPIFELSNGETLKNVIIGKPASDGVHCTGSCTLENVWWEDVGEDAASLLGTGSPTMTIDCGGAKQASDKVFQHNSGGTMIIRNFTVDFVSKMYRSCGNCDNQFTRHVQLENITALNTSRIVGLNENYDDTATFSNILTTLNAVVCERYTGCEGCSEPSANSSGPDPDHCLYEYTDIHY